MNPGYQIPEIDYCLKKVDVKAIIMPETFKTQKYYEMLATLIPSMKNSKTTIQDNNVNSLKHVIVYSDKNFP
jgi:medium-chain acyl-CoA ligase, mitochondrial